MPGTARRSVVLVSGFISSTAVHASLLFFLHPQLAPAWERSFVPPGCMENVDPHHTSYQLPSGLAEMEMYQDVLRTHLRAPSRQHKDGCMTGSAVVDCVTFHCSQPAARL
ncbi:hypothetical protein RRG08_064848 [Elysia crispata]|uniref:Uncharacterized protein n=1 Tax=Elysia crispata TaxID=231223 RepID=A0AAE1A2C1_9GAST|nr:hypothetical protein RRG08_064848 [Elysia crispata]